MRRLLPLVSAVAVVDTMLYAALVPLLPHFERAYGLSKGGVGALVAAYAIGVLAGALPGGVLASRIGSRGAVLGGLALMTAASLGFALAGSFNGLFAARLAQGLGSSLTWAGGLSWLANATPRERRGEAMGTAMGAALFGALLGPVIGAVASVVGVRAAFSAVAALGIVLATWALRLEPAPPEPQSLGVAVRALSSRAFLAGLWLITLPALLFGVLSVLVPLALAGRGFGAVAIGAVWLASAALEGAFNPFLGRVTDRHGLGLPIRLALVGSIAVSLVLAATHWPPALVALVIAAAFAYGAFYAPGLTFLSRAAEEAGLAQGLAFGLMNASWAIGNSVGPAAGGALAQAAGDAVPYLIGAGICAATLVLVRRVLAHESVAVSPASRTP